MTQALTSGLIVWVVMAMGTPLATASDTAASEPIESPPVSEASRLDEVRALVNAMPPTTLVSALPPDESISGHAFCRRLLMDLSEPGAIAPLEPFAVLSHPFPSAIPTVSSMPTDAEIVADRVSVHKLGASLAKRINYCFTDSPNDALRFEGFDKFVGGPPYRVYAVPPVLRKRSRSELIYWTERDEAFKSGRHGYVVADLGNCVHRGGVGSLTGYWFRNKDPSSFRSALVMQGRSVVAWDVAPGFAVKASVLGRGSDNDWHSKAICRWQVEAADSTTR